MKSRTKRFTCIAAVASVLVLQPLAARAYLQRAVGGDMYVTTDEGLKNATLLIVRHGEKDGLGPGLSPAGEMRALAYAHYFQHFKLDGTQIHIDALVASEDSKKSERPRLTLEPLSSRMGLVIYQPSPDHEVADLVAWLRARPAGRTTLISWHHNHIAPLVAALGGNPNAYLPHGAWPDDAFDWVLALRFDADGKVIASASHLIREPSKLDNKVWAAMDHPTVLPLDSSRPVKNGNALANSG
jgi:hypothetical protein